MERKKFVKSLLTGLAGMTTLAAFSKLAGNLSKREKQLPVLFIGHGSPMNAIEDNEFSRGWKQLANQIETPAAILIISAHWLTKGTAITAMEHPKTIHDFGGFPQELFNVNYPAPGNPALAKETAGLIHSAIVGLDHDWGLDHGAWSIARNMYPTANIPILQLSIDYTKNAKYHYDLAHELSALRNKGVLIIGSGNMVHNLPLMNWKMMQGGGFEWAESSNEKFKKLIQNGDHDSLIHYDRLGSDVALAIPTPEHYLPLIYSLGLKTEQDDIHFFNDKTVGGSISMTSVRIHSN